MVFIPSRIGKKPRDKTNMLLKRRMLGDDSEEISAMEVNSRFKV